MTYLLPKCAKCQQTRWVDTLPCECGSNNVLYPKDVEY